MSKTLEELKQEFINSETEAIFNEVKEEATKVLEKIVSISLQLEGDENDAIAAKKSIELLQSSLSDLALAAKDKGFNYAFNRLERFVSNIIINNLLSKL